MSDLLAFVAVTFFWSWVFSVIIFIFKGFSSFDKFNERAAMIFGAVSVSCFLLWLLALRVG